MFALLLTMMLGSIAIATDVFTNTKLSFTIVAVILLFTYSCIVLVTCVTQISLTRDRYIRPHHHCHPIKKYPGTDHRVVLVPNKRLFPNVPTLNKKCLATLCVIICIIIDTLQLQPKFIIVPLFSHHDISSQLVISIRETEILSSHLIFINQHTYRPRNTDMVFLYTTRMLLLVVQHLTYLYCCRIIVSSSTSLYYYYNHN